MNLHQQIEYSEILRKYNFSEEQIEEALRLYDCKISHNHNSPSKPLRVDEEKLKIRHKKFVQKLKSSMKNNSK
jgi:hypothetical protein